MNYATMKHGRSVQFVLVSHLKLKTLIDCYQLSRNKVLDLNAIIMHQSIKQSVGAWVESWRLSDILTKLSMLVTANHNKFYVKCHLQERKSVISSQCFWHHRKYSTCESAVRSLPPIVKNVHKIWVVETLLDPAPQSSK